MKHLALTLFAFALCLHLIHAAVPLKWTVETSRLQPVSFDAVRGETLALEATFKSYGTDVATSNQTAFLYWQTNGMDSAWWVTNAVTSGSSASVLFTPEMDPGAPVVHAFLGLAETNQTIQQSSNPTISYRAAFTIRFRKGPGATPNVIDAPPKILDIANTVVVNSPWPTTNDFAVATTNLETKLKGYVDGQILEAGLVTPTIVTNIVKAVVTNDVCGSTVVGSRFATPVVYAYSSETVDYAITNLAVRWNGEYWEMHVGGWADMQTYHDGWYKCATTNWNSGNPYSVVNSNRFTDAVTVWIGDKTATGFSQNIGDGLRTYANGTQTYTVSNGTHNALGLAYERDIRPTISNTVTAAYVESLGISAGLTTNEVNALIASPAVTNEGAVTAAVAMTNVKRDMTNMTVWVVGSVPATNGVIPSSSLPISGGSLDYDWSSYTLMLSSPDAGHNYYYSLNSKNNLNAGTFTFNAGDTTANFIGDEKVRFNGSSSCTITIEYPLVPNDSLATTNWVVGSAITSKLNKFNLSWLGDGDTASLYFNAHSAYFYGSGILGLIDSNHLRIEGNPLPMYLDSLDWRTTGNRSLSSYGITNDIPADTSAAVAALATTTATHTASIAGWETYWTGDKVRLSVTNYYGNTSGELPRLRIEEFDHSVTTTVSGVDYVTNVYKVVWDEEARHTNYQATVDAKVDSISNTVMDAAWQQTYLQLANKAPRAWQGVTSAGEAAPENTVWMTAPNTVFAGGTEYAHVAVGEGTICVLVDKGAPVYTEGEEGTFHFYDESRQYYFGFDIRDSYTIGCRTDGISVSPSEQLVTLTYDLTASDDPTILHSTNLVDWAEQSVTWESNPPAGSKICYINVGSDPKGFYKAQMSYAGGAKFITNMQADLAGGIAASNETLNVIQNVYPVITSTGVVWRVKN